MKLKLFLIFFIYFSASAQNLSEIISVINSSKIATSLKDRSYADIAIAELDISQSAPELELSIAHAKDPIDEGLEYGFGISQSIAHPFTLSKKNKASENMSKAIQQELKHEIHLISLEVSKAYHSTCVAKEMKEKSALLYEQQSKRFSQFQRAYDLGDISKSTLLFNKLDLAKLKQYINVYKRKYLVELSSLQSLVDSLEIDNVSCNDLFDIQKEITLKSVDEHSEVKRLSYELTSSESYLDVYDSTFQTIGYGVAYEKELETKRLSFGINIPLGFLTSQTQMKKAEYLHQSSALASQRGSLKHQIKSETKSLVLKIETLYDEYTLLHDEILPLSKDLLDLSKTSLLEGEGTIMEYLDSSRSYAENMIETLQSKKKYYDELFELYQTADLELGENYENIY